MDFQIENEEENIEYDIVEHVKHIMLNRKMK